MRITNKKTYTTIQNIKYILPLLFIVVIFLLHITLQDKTFSKEEKRYLTQWPIFNIERVIDVSFETKVESYFSDQFPFRNFWISIHESTNRIIFKNDYKQ